MCKDADMCLELFGGRPTPASGKGVGWLFITSSFKINKCKWWILNCKLIVSLFSRFIQIAHTLSVEIDKGPVSKCKGDLHYHHTQA